MGNGFADKELLLQWFLFCKAVVGAVYPAGVMPARPKRDRTHFCVFFVTSGVFFESLKIFLQKLLAG